MNAFDDYGNGDSSDEVVSSDDEHGRLGRRLPRARYTTVDADEDDETFNRRGKRSREEAIYGVFMDDDDSEEEGFRKKQRRKKSLFKETSSSSSKLAPLFVKGDVLQDNNDNEKDEKDTETDEKPDASNNSLKVNESKEESQHDPSKEELELKKQLEEANQNFLSLLDRAKRKRTRPTLATQKEHEKRTPESMTDEQPKLGLGMSRGGIGSTDSAPPSASAMSFTSAGAVPIMGGHGLGMKPSVKKDPNLGKWEKHTKGIGMKLLEKMGYKGSGGLGSKRRQEEQKAGISRAVEVKVRPANLGLGFGGFREASTLKINRQLEAQVRGEAVPKPETKPAMTDADTTTRLPASALPTVDELLQDSFWQKGAREAKKKKEKQRRTVVPYDQLLESKDKQQPMKIVDLRGPEVAAVETPSATDEPIESGPPALGEELLHNVSLLLKTHESKLHSHSQFASAAEQKLNSLQSEVTDLERQKSMIQERSRKMEKALEILDAYQSHIENGDFQKAGQTRLDAAVSMVEELCKVFSPEDRKSLKFDTSLAPTLLGDALQSALKRWNPFRKVSSEEDSIRLIKSVVHLPLTMDKESAMMLKRNLFIKYILPKIQKAYESAHWDAQEQTGIAVHFYENLLDLVKQGFDFAFDDESGEESVGATKLTEKIRRAVIFEAVHPKLERALSAWKPSLNGDLKLVHPPHEWILPWVPFLDHPGILPTLMSQCKRRIDSAVSFLARKVPDDNEVFLNGFISTLRPWARAFKTSSVHDMTSKYASERFAASLGKSEESDAARMRLFEFHEDGVMSSIDFLALLEFDLLCRFVIPTHAEAMSAKTNAAELAEVYVERKSKLETLTLQFPSSRKLLCADEMGSRCLLAVLRMIEAVSSKDADSLSLLEPPSKSISYATIRARRIRDHKRNAQVEMLRMESGNKDGLATDTRARFIRQDNNSKATFREVVEEFCLQESIPFAPRTTGARTHVDGKQVFLFGKIPIYLDTDVVFAHQGHEHWEPVSLESLLERARAAE